MRTMPKIIEDSLFVVELSGEGSLVSQIRFAERLHSLLRGFRVSVLAKRGAEYAIADLGDVAIREIDICPAYSTDTVAGIKVLQCGYTLHPERELDWLRMNYRIELVDGFEEGFYTYGKKDFRFRDLSVGFPLSKEPTQRIWLDRRVRRNGWSSPESIKKRNTENIAEYGKAAFLWNPSERIVLGVLNTGELELEELKIGREEDGAYLSFIAGRMGCSSNEELRDGFKLVVYTPQSDRFWWQEGLEYADSIGLTQVTFRLTLNKRSFVPKETARVYVLGKRDKKAQVQLERLGTEVKEVCAQEIGLRSEVEDLPLKMDDLPSGLYRVRVSCEGQKRSIALVVRPVSPSREILYIVATNSWRAYAGNGYYHFPGHSYPFNYGFMATVLDSNSEEYDNFPSPYFARTEGVIATLDELPYQVDYCCDEDVHFGRVRLSDYRLVILDNHAEYVTRKERAAFKEYIDNGGPFLFLGGDNLGREVEYIPDQEEFRYQHLYGGPLFVGGGGYYYFPDGAQYSDEQRLRDFGISVLCEPGMAVPPRVNSIPKQEAPPIVVAKRHPITEGYEVGEEIAPAYSETDVLTDDWEVLLRLDYQGNEYPCLALRNTNRVGYLGPISVAETLAGRFGGREKLKDIFSRTLSFLLAKGEEGRKV